jgi:acyl-CoA thioesterase
MSKSSEKPSTMDRLIETLNVEKLEENLFRGRARRMAGSGFSAAR